MAHSGNQIRQIHICDTDGKLLEIIPIPKIRSRKGGSQPKEAIDKIRNWVNVANNKELLLKNSIDWCVLCSAMDVIGDVELAIDEYKNYKQHGYLTTYGILQALFIQQDAINELSQCLLGETVNYKKNHKELFSIRKIRNSSIGHPAKETRGEHPISTHQIIRTSISKDGFELITTSFLDAKKKNEPRKRKAIMVNLKRILNKQSKLTNKILANILLKLELKEYKQGLSSVAHDPDILNMTKEDLNAWGREVAR